MLVARRREKLEELANAVHDATGVDVTVIAADLSDPQAPAQLCKQLQEAGIEIDYLVNNAAIFGDMKIELGDV